MRDFTKIAVMSQQIGPYFCGRELEKARLKKSTKKVVGIHEPKAGSFKP
jgi:hypothetical protein